MDSCSVHTQHSNTYTSNCGFADVHTSHWYAWVKACYWSLWARLTLIKESNEIRGRGVVVGERCADGCGKEDSISMKSVSEGGRDIKLEDERGWREKLASLERCRGSISRAGPGTWVSVSRKSIFSTLLELLLCVHFCLGHF